MPPAPPASWPMSRGSGGLLVRLLSHETWTITEGTGFEGAQRLANLDRLLDLLTNGRHGDLHEVAEFLERNARVETEDEESPLFDLDFAAVRVLTVHAAKGLEFGAVIVPDLARRHFVHERFEDARVERLLDGQGHELVGIRIGACRNAHSFRVGMGGNEIGQETMHQYYLFFGLIRLNDVDIQRVVGDLTSYDVEMGFAYRDGFVATMSDFFISSLFLPLTVTRQAITVKY